MEYCKRFIDATSVVKWLALYKIFLINVSFKLRLDPVTQLFENKNREFPKAVSSVVASLHWPLMILTVIPQNVKFSLYVDDLLIYTAGVYVPFMERRLQRAISDIEQ